MHRPQGWRVNFFLEAAVADVDGPVLVVQLRSSSDAFARHGMHNIAASLFSAPEGTSNMPTHEADGIDLARWLDVHVRQRQVPTGRTAVYAEMDVDGAEFVVLPRMLNC
eukprot:3489048-Prymnesium_polylepis.1